MCQQTDSTYGTASGGRMCGAPLDNTTAVDAGSHDPDTAELDTIVPIQPTSTFYSPILYAMVSLSRLQKAGRLKCCLSSVLAVLSGC